MTMQKFVLLLLILVLLGPLAIDLYLPVIPAIAQGLSSDTPTIQSTISLFIMIMGLGQLVAGPLVDRVGRRPMALIGIVIYIIGAVISALANNGAVFIASRVLQSVAVCCTAVVVFSCVRDRLNGDDAARTFGFLNGTLNIVPALAPFFGGLLSEAFGWRACFWFLTLYACVVLFIALRYLPETRPANTLRLQGLPVKQYVRILFTPQFLGFSASNAGIMAMALTYLSMASVVLMVHGGLSSLQFSLVFGANGFWVMAMSLLATRMIVKIGRPVCLTLGVILISSGFLLLCAIILWVPETLQSRWWIFMSPIVVAFAGLAFAIGPATSYALEPYANEAGTASALVGFVQMAGGAIVGLAIMALPLSPQATLALSMLCAALLALRAQRLSRKMRGTLTALTRDAV